MGKTLTPFPWFGGKAMPNIRNAIINAMPEHDKYIEPFGGGGSILLNKSPVKVEVYNDVNRGIVNFFRVLADPLTFGQFFGRVANLPVSRELWEEYNRTWVGVHDPVEQAARWYYVARQSFAGRFGGSWGMTVNHSSRNMASSASRWTSAIESLPAVHSRMRRVQIECCDFRDCLDRYSGKGWLAYCDPPYVMGTRKAGGYEHELKDSDHEDLIEAVLHYDGAVILSGYNHPLYAPLRTAGWDKLEIQTTCSAAGRTRASGLQGHGNVLAKQKRTECVWRNPVAMKA